MAINQKSICQSFCLLPCPPSYPGVGCLLKHSQGKHAANALLLGQSKQNIKQVNNNVCDTGVFNKQNLGGLFCGYFHWEH